VTDLESGRSVVVTVNDRGPFANGRVVDLSLAAARKLGMVQRGLARVRVEPAR
jgi:rare lipoprotein A